MGFLIIELSCEQTKEFYVVTKSMLIHEGLSSQYQPKVRMGSLENVPSSILRLSCNYMQALLIHDCVAGKRKLDKITGEISHINSPDYILLHKWSGYPPKQDWNKNLYRSFISVM